MKLVDGQKLRVKEFDETPSHWRVEMKKWMVKLLHLKNILVMII